MRAVGCAAPRARPGRRARASGMPTSPASCRWPSMPPWWAIPRSCGAGWSRSTASASECSWGFRWRAARSHASRSCSDTCASRTTAACSTCARSSSRRTSPTPRSASARTPTTPTATRCPRCSCCTACRRARRAARARSSTASAWPRRCAPARPPTFALLAGHCVTFAYRDEGAELSASAPLIELDPHGAVRAVRFNSRSLKSPSHAAPELAAWYDAYLRFGRMLEDERFQVRLRLEPGDLFIVDNRRVLHGRAPLCRERRRAASPGLLRRHRRPAQHARRARARAGR